MQVLPADSLEEDVVALGAVFDTSQQSHWRIGANRIVELHRIQVLDCDPSKNGPDSIKTIVIGGFITLFR